MGPKNACGWLFLLKVNGNATKQASFSAQRRRLTSSKAAQGIGGLHVAGDDDDDDDGTKGGFD